MEKSNTSGHNLVREATFKGDMQGNFFYTKGGECLEGTAGLGRYDGGF